MDTEELKKKVFELEEENQKLKEHLKRYTAPENTKEYYKRNRERVIQRVKEYQKKNPVSKEKQREYSRKAYLKKKANLQNSQILGQEK